jgi:hypothetical protein
MGIMWEIAGKVGRENRPNFFELSGGVGLRMSYPPPQDGANERKNMKIRSDSPFAKLTEEDKKWILDFSECMTIEEMLDHMEVEHKIETSRSAMQRFLARLRTERLVQDAKDKNSDLEDLAEAGRNSTSRDAALELARQKLVDVAANANGGEHEKLVEVVKSLSEEKAREHESAMRERAMKVAEENAKLGWRKLELQQARSALRLLPTIRAILLEGEMGAEERVARAREFLMRDGGKLLLEKNAA